MRRYTFAGIGLLVASVIALVVKALSLVPPQTRVDAGHTASIGPFISDVNFLEVAACLGVALALLLIIAGLSGAPKGVLGYRI